MKLASSRDRAPGRPVSRQVLADHVYEELLAWLMDGRLEPGAAVSIDGTARELDVSPTPVREALARLEHTGLVRRVALKGYRVAPVFTREDFGELMEARLAIEPVNARLACGRITSDGLTELREAVKDLETAPRGPSFAEFRDYLEADERFHKLIAEQSGNQFMLSAYNALGGQVQRFRLFGEWASPTPSRPSLSTGPCSMRWLAGIPSKPRLPWRTTFARSAPGLSPTLLLTELPQPGCDAPVD